MQKTSIDVTTPIDDGARDGRDATRGDVSVTTARVERGRRRRRRRSNGRLIGRLID